MAICIGELQLDNNGESAEQGLKCKFKVVGTVKVPGPPAKIRGPLSILQRAPCISSQAVILTRFRLTSSLENFSSSILHIPGRQVTTITI